MRKLYSGTPSGISLGRVQVALLGGKVPTGSAGGGGMVIWGAAGAVVEAARLLGPEVFLLARLGLRCDGC